MDLTQAQQSAWLHQPVPPETSRQALARMRESLHLAMAALEDGQALMCQQQLETLLLEVLIAMHTFNLDASAAFDRALHRMQQGNRQRAFHVYTDRVEIRVGNEVRGAWPLVSEQDYEAALQLALELGCDVVHEEALQLALFGHA